MKYYWGQWHHVKYLQLTVNHDAQAQSNQQAITHINTTKFTWFGKNAYVHGKGKLWSIILPSQSRVRVIDYMRYIIPTFLALKKTPVQLTRCP